MELTFAAFYHACVYGFANSQQTAVSTLLLGHFGILHSSVSSNICAGRRKVPLREQDDISALFQSEEGRNDLWTRIDCVINDTVAAARAARCLLRESLRMDCEQMTDKDVLITALAKSVCHPKPQPLTKDEKAFLATFRLGVPTAPDESLLSEISDLPALSDPKTDSVWHDSENRLHIELDDEAAIDRFESQYDIVYDQQLIQIKCSADKLENRIKRMENEWSNFPVNFEKIDENDIQYYINLFNYWTELICASRREFAIHLYKLNCIMEDSEAFFEYGIYETVYKKAKELQGRIGRLKWKVERLFEKQNVYYNTYRRIISAGTMPHLCLKDPYVYMRGLEDEGPEFRQAIMEDSFDESSIYGY